MRTINNNIVQRNTYMWISDYIADQPLDSVERNKHMNAFSLTKKRPAGKHQDVKELLWEYCSYIDWRKLEGIRVIDLLHLLTHTAKMSIITLRADYPQLGADFVDALIIDLINYVGMRMGVDYAIYTTDL